MFIATGCYSGYLPKAPGTWGSLVGLLLFFLLHTLSLEIYLAVIASIFLLGTFAAGEAEKIMDHPDPGLHHSDRVINYLYHFDLDLRSSLTELIEQLIRQATARSESRFEVKDLGSHLRVNPLILVERGR